MSIDDRDSSHYKVVVTGATGKTGSEVVKLLLEQSILIPLLGGPSLASVRAVHVALAVRSIDRGVVSLKRTVESICAQLSPQIADLFRDAVSARTSCVLYVQEQASTHAAVVAGAGAL